MSVEILAPVESPKYSMHGQIVHFLGAEGSGKSITARRLAKETGLPYISTGDVLRHMRDNDQGPLGEMCREMFEQNKYFMDREKLLEIYTKVFEDDKFKDGFVFDGAMRDLIETQGIGEALHNAGRDLPLTNVFLRTPGWKSLERLSSNPDARGRDDSVESVTSRLMEYSRDLPQRASFIRNNQDWNMVRVLSVNNSPDEVFSNVVAGLSNLGVVTELA